MNSNGTDRNRITEYEVPSNLDGIDAVVGWDGNDQSYWCEMKRLVPSGYSGPGQDAGDLYLQIGSPIPGDQARAATLSDLVDLTWEDINWPATDESILHSLHDDPTFEAMQWRLAEYGGRRVWEQLEFFRSLFLERPQKVRDPREDWPSEN